MEIEGSQAALNRAYVYANGRLIAEQAPDGQFYWTHNDHLNSTRKLTNTSGVAVYRAEFDPFGQAVLETGLVSLNSHKYTGYERDWATGLDNAQARMYASLRGRFMQSDPITYGCGNKNPDILAGANKRLPQSLNRYGYVRNDPANFYDPSGLNLENPDGANSGQEPLCGTGFMCPGMRFFTTYGDGHWNLNVWIISTIGGVVGQSGGGSPQPQNTCDPCCESAKNTCQLALGACLSAVTGTLVAGMLNCNNNPFCMEENPAYDAERCGRCKQAVFAVAGGGTAACLLIYSNCMRGRTNGCSTKIPAPCVCK